MVPNSLRCPDGAVLVGIQEFPEAREGHPEAQLSQLSLDPVGFIEVEYAVADAGQEHARCRQEPPFAEPVLDLPPSPAALVHGHDPTL